MDEHPRWASLAEGETVRWSSRPSLYPTLWTVLKALAVGCIGLVVWLAGEGYVEPGPSMPASSPATLIGSLLVGVGVMAAVSPLLGWVGAGYLVTSDAVYRKRGLLFRSVSSQSLADVRDVSVSQSIAGDVLSYGYVTLATADEFVLRHVPGPETVAGDLSGDD